MAWKDTSEGGRRDEGEEHIESGRDNDEGGGDDHNDEKEDDDEDAANREEIENEDVLLIRHEDDVPTKQALSSVTSPTTEPPFRQNKSNSPSRPLNQREIVVAMGHDAENDVAGDFNPSQKRLSSSATRASSSRFPASSVGAAVPSEYTSLTPRVLSRKSAAITTARPAVYAAGNSPPALLHRHAYTHLAVQQVRQIEKQRRLGHLTMPRNHSSSQPKTAEQFYQWLSTSTSQAPSAPASNPNRRRRRNDAGEMEYRLGLGSSGHDKSRARSEHRQGQEITLVPAECDDEEGSFCSSGADNATSARRDDDNDDESDEDTAVAVATMMGMAPAMHPDAAHFGHAQSTDSHDKSTAGAAVAAAAVAWQQASRVVAECHERMVSVQANAKLKQQQLRLHNEHLMLLLEASKVSIEQLQMRLIFSKDTSPLPLSSSLSPARKQHAPSSPLQQGGVGSSVGDDHSSIDNNNHNKSRPSLSDVREHVESVLAHQHVLLEENSALKQALLQCGCDNCLEQYRVRQRASSNAMLSYDDPLNLQGGHATDPDRSDPGVADTGLNSQLSSDIPIPSMVPTEDSTSSSSSTSSRLRSLSPVHSEPVDPSSAVDGSASVVITMASGDGDIADPDSTVPETNTTSDKNVHHDEVAANAIAAYEKSRVESIAASDHDVDDNRKTKPDPSHTDDQHVKNAESVAKRKKVAPGKRASRRARSESGGPSLGEYLTTTQDGMNTSGSLAEHEYDRRYSRSFAGSISLLSSMSRITFKTIDEDITVDYSMVDDEARRIDDSTARLEASADVSMTLIEPAEVGQEDSLRTFTESNGSTPPNRHSFVGSASSITTSLSNCDHADSFRASAHSGEATVLYANRGRDPERSSLPAPIDPRLGRPRRGRKATLASSLQDRDVHDVSLDQVFLSSDPSKFISSPALAPFAKSQVQDAAESPSVQTAHRSAEVQPDGQPKDHEVWQQKYVNSDDLYSSAVMSAMEKRKKGASILPRYGRDSNSERFVAELSKCLQGSSTHSTVIGSVLPSDPLLASKALPVPSAMRSPQPLSYDDAIVAAMRKESAHVTASGPITGTVPSSTSQRKGQWKAPTVFKSWK